jgi:hypothetical protein
MLFPAASFSVCLTGFAIVLIYAYYICLTFPFFRLQFLGLNRFSSYQCCGCNIFHKLVDNLNLFHEMKCYVGPDFRYEGDAPFNYLDRGEDGDNIFPIL